MAPARVAAKVHFGFGRAEAVGALEAFICKACGYTEWYANGLEQLEPDADAGIQLIDNRPKAGLR